MISFHILSFLYKLLTMIIRVILTLFEHFVVIWNRVVATQELLEWKRERNTVKRLSNKAILNYGGVYLTIFKNAPTFNDNVLIFN